jgi:hypothetical protein
MSRWGSGIAAAVVVGIAALACGREATELPLVSPPPPVPDTPGGSVLAPAILASDEHGPLELAADADRLYWGTTEAGTGPSIRTVSKAGGPRSTLVTVPRQMHLPGGINFVARVAMIQVDADWIFFSVTEEERIPHHDDVASVTYATAFYRMAKAGGEAEPFPSFPGMAEEILPGPFSAHDDFLYFLDVRLRENSFATGVTLLAFPKAGGEPTTIRLEAPSKQIYSVDSIAMDEQHWYVAHSNHSGDAHIVCVSRAPKAGGVLENVWCPEFRVQLMPPGGGRLLATGSSSDVQNLWSVDLPSGAATSAARLDKGKYPGWVVADRSGGSAYAIESKLGSMIPLVPASSDLVRIDLVSGRRIGIDHQEEALHRGLVVDDAAVFSTRGGEVLRFAQ